MKSTRQKAFKKISTNCGTKWPKTFTTIRSLHPSYKTRQQEESIHRGYCTKLIFWKSKLMKSICYYESLQKRGCRYPPEVGWQNTKRMLVARITVIEMNDKLKEAGSDLKKKLKKQAKLLSRWENWRKHKVRQMPWRRPLKESWKILASSSRNYLRLLNLKIIAGVQKFQLRTGSFDYRC